jgi:Serine-threonine protein kinase 19
VVVKRKSKANSSSLAATKQRPASMKGLPSFGGTFPTTTFAITEDAVVGDNESDGYALFANMACDTLLAIQNLKSKSIAIPLPHQRYIYGVLECQVYSLLQDNHVEDTIVSGELQALTQSNMIRMLSSTQKGLIVLLETVDYITAIRDCFPLPSDALATTAVEWFIKHMRDWTGYRISISQLEESWAIDPIPNYTLDSTLQKLLHRQLLMASHMSSYYQLWLPSWGTVLSAWETARKKLLLKLKRSAYKERSLQALDQEYSPIPTPVLIDWLVAKGQVEIVLRPAGKFVKLSFVEK